MSTEESSLLLLLLLLLRRRRIIIAATFFFFFFLIIIMGIYTDDANSMEEFSSAHYKTNLGGGAMLSVTHHHRKLLLLLLLNHHHGNEKEKVVVAEPNRIWSDKCSKSDIVISQGATEPLPSGIPTYTVEIMNTSGCDISAIHLNCGWFSSVRILNPRVFKRLRFDDCLVNDGKPLLNGRTLSFQYANTFRYPLTVSSINC